MRSHPGKRKEFFRPICIYFWWELLCSFLAQECIDSDQFVIFNASVFATVSFLWTKNDIWWAAFCLQILHWNIFSCCWKYNQIWFVLESWMIRYNWLNSTERSITMLLIQTAIAIRFCVATVKVLQPKVNGFFYGQLFKFSQLLAEFPFWPTFKLLLSHKNT